MQTMLKFYMHYQGAQTSCTLWLQHGTELLYAFDDLHVAVHHGLHFTHVQSWSTQSVEFVKYLLLFDLLLRYFWHD